MDLEGKIANLTADVADLDSSVFDVRAFANRLTESTASFDRFAPRLATLRPGVE